MADRRRLLDQLQRERRKGIEAWERVCQTPRTGSSLASATPSNLSSKGPTAHPFRDSRTARRRPD